MEKKRKETILNFACIGAPFVVGLVFFLAVGWLLFPMIIYGQKDPEFNFSHQIHVDNSVDCAICHNSGPGESIAPGIAICASCHNANKTQGKNPSAEQIRLINEYVVANKEINWLFHQKQPDNVFFSHTVHSIETCATPSCHPYWQDETDAFCSNCHLPVAQIDLVPYEYNRLTGYSKQTMKMDVCESCHASPSHLRMSGLTDEEEMALLEGRPRVRVQANASNACFTCHK